MIAGILIALWLIAIGVAVLLGVAGLPLVALLLAPGLYGAAFG